MTKEKYVLKCYIESEGLKRLQVIFEDGKLSTWDEQGLDDSIESLDDLVSKYTDIFYDSIEDFKNGYKCSFNTWVLNLSD